MQFLYDELALSAGTGAPGGDALGALVDMVPGAWGAGSGGFCMDGMWMLFRGFRGGVALMFSSYFGSIIRFLYDESVLLVGAGVLGGDTVIDTSILQIRLKRSS